MSNQLTDLFKMDDTRDVPDAVIAEVIAAAGWGADVEDVRHDAAEGYASDRTLIAFARHIAREHPEWIEDPDLATVRELWAVEREREGADGAAKDIRAKKHDDAPGMKIRLAAFKAGRAAERAGQ